MLGRFLDTAVSIAAVVLAVCAVWMVAFGRESSEGPALLGSPLPPVYQVSEQVAPVPGVDFAARSQTLLIVVRSDCPYCDDSAPFYRRLVEHVKRSAADVQIVAAAFAADAGFSDYIEQHELEIHASVVLAPGALKVRATPMLLLLDREGRVKGLWEGRLSPANEGVVVKALSG